MQLKKKRENWQPGKNFIYPKELGLLTEKEHFVLLINLFSFSFPFAYWYN